MAVIFMAIFLFGFALLFLAVVELAKYIQRKIHEKKTHDTLVRTIKRRGLKHDFKKR